MSEQPTPDYVAATASSDLVELSPSALDSLIVALADAIRAGTTVRLQLTLDVFPPPPAD